MTRAALALAAALLPALAPAASFEVESFPGDRGGPAIVLARRPGRTATLLVTFAAGSFDDGDRPGLTRVAQQALLAANRRLDLRELMVALHAGAAELEITTAQRECAFVLTADRRDFLPIARLLLDALLAPRLVPGRYPAAVARTLLDGRSGPGLVGVVAELAADDGRYRNPIVGRRADVEAIRADDVAAHLAGPLSPANATVVVAGAFDRDEVVRAVRRYRGGRASPRTRAELSLPFATRRSSAQELHLLAHPIRLATPADAAAARVLEALLDDVLWRRFREVGVGYTYAVQVFRSSWLDALVLALPARDPSAIDLGPHLRDAVSAIREGRFTDAELDRARGAARTALERDDADPAALAAALAAGGPSWHGAQVAAALETMGRADLLATARGWLDPASSVYAYLGQNP